MKNREKMDILEKQTLELCKKTISIQQSPQFSYQLYFLALNSLGVLNYQNSSISGENYLIENILPKLIQESFPVFFDVGAYHGDFTLMLNKRFPSATIHSFEPHPKNFQILEQIDIRNIYCHNLAVGDKKGYSTIYDRSDIDGSTHASL